MKNKFFLLSALLGLTMTAASSADEGFYVSVLGGPNWVNEIHRREHRDHGDLSNCGGQKGHKNHRRTKVDFKTGYLVGAAAGYQFCGNFSLEGEFTYRRNQIDRVHHHKNKHGNKNNNGNNQITNNNGNNNGVERSNFRRHRDLEVYAVLANVRYDWPLDCFCFMPYIKGGIGYGNTRFSTRHHERRNVNGCITECDRHRRHNQSSFAWQVGAGVTIPDILCNTSLDIGYTYFSTTNNRNINNNIGHNSLVVAARYMF